MNVLHLPSVSGITRGNGERAVKCQRPVWWYHQRWPLILSEGRGMWSVLARTTTLSKTRFAVALCTDMRLRLSCAKNHCQNRISVCVCAAIWQGYFSTDSSGQLWDLFLPEAILWKSIHLLPHKHIHWHIHIRTQTHRSLRAYKKTKTLTSDASAEALLWEVGLTAIALR